MAWRSTLTLAGNRLSGELSEVASGAPTSTVTGTLDPVGVATLDFQGSSAEHFTGRVDGAMRGMVLNVAFQSQTARACHYTFELARAR